GATLPMSRILIKSLFATSLALLLLSGCHHGCPRPAPAPGPQPFVVPPGAGTPFAPMPNGIAPLPEPPIPPAPVPSQSKSLDPNQLLPGQDWKPGSGPTVRLYPPEIVESDGGGAGGSAPGGKKILLRPPEVIEEGNSTPKSDGGGPPKSSAVPPGIPQFAVVRDGVASGLRPSLEGGLDWLQANGYKTVVCLHHPGEPDATDRKQAEKRGMLFVSFEVSPGTLTRKALDAFK